MIQFFFFHDTKSSSFGEGFWKVLEDLHEFFKFNLCSYNIIKKKNILIISINFFVTIISINLSLSKKLHFQIF